MKQRTTDLSSSKTYGALETFVNLVLLNLIWLLLCLPVITIFAATAAMFGVVREWEQGIQNGSVMPFFQHFKANFLQSTGLGLLGSLVFAILLTDFLLIRQLSTWLQGPLLMACVIAGFCLFATSIFLLPVMVNYQAKWLVIIRNSFLIALGQLGTTLVCMLVVLVVLFLLYVTPLTLLFAGSGTAYVLYTLCSRAFRRIEAIKRAQAEKAS